MARRAAKVDDNQGAIVDAVLNLPGYSVQSLAGVGCGCPDLLIGAPSGHILMEVKNREGRGLGLTPDQKTWHATWLGPVFIVSSPTEAIAVLEQHLPTP